MRRKSEEYVTTLHQLIEESDHKAVEDYIREKGVRPALYYRYLVHLFGHESFCTSAVALAAKCGKTKVLKTLLEFGFSVNRAHFTLDVIRPIDRACEGGSVDAVKVLVEEYGVDILNDEYLSYYRPTMCLAAKNGHIEVLKYFLTKGVSVNKKFGMMSVTALHSAAFHKGETCEFLLSEGADVNARDFKDTTPLINAAGIGSVNSTGVLLDAGAEVNVITEDGETAFNRAATNNNLDVMRLLHSRGADPEINDCFFKSPLHSALENNNYNMTYFLVNELNVSLNLPDYYDPIYSAKLTTCSLPLENGRYDLVKLLINAGYDPSKELAEYLDYEDDLDIEDEEFEILEEDPPEYFHLWSRERRKRWRRTRDRVKLQELRDMILRPRSLMMLCILQVRHLIGRRFAVGLNILPLPKIVKDQILTCGEKEAAGGEKEDA